MRLDATSCREPATFSIRLYEESLSYVGSSDDTQTGNVVSNEHSNELHEFQCQCSEPVVQWSSNTVHGTGFTASSPTRAIFPAAGKRYGSDIAVLHIRKSEAIVAQKNGNGRSMVIARADVVTRLGRLLETESDNFQLRVCEICLALNVSYGTLRSICVRNLGATPKKYLLQRQMRLARYALQQNDRKTTSVTRVATEYGFSELGRFAVNYRKMFGESPSATLRQAIVSTTPQSEYMEPKNTYQRDLRVSGHEEIAQLRRQVEIRCRDARVLIKLLRSNLEIAQERISRSQRLRDDIRETLRLRTPLARGATHGSGIRPTSSCKSRQTGGVSWGSFSERVIVAFAASRRLGPGD
jgi:AraC-like DNA-binding protein